MLRSKNRSSKTWWHPDEDNVVFRHFPDYPKIHRKLPHRSLSAIQQRSRYLKLTTRKKHFWTSREVAVLRKLYRQADYQTVRAALPGRSAPAVRTKAHKLRCSRPRRKPVVVGDNLIDAIIRRAFELNFSVLDLDLGAKTGWYFRMRRKRRAIHRNILKAIAYLEGDLTIVWRD